MAGGHVQAFRHFAVTEVSGRAFPRRNPFPVTATASQDERPAGPAAESWVLGLPTVPLPAVEQVWRVTKTYLKSSADGCSSYGQVAFVHGDHGAGKTHAVLHALGRVPELTGEPYRFYVKAEDDDFVALYRRLMGQLDLATLRDISLRFLGTIAGEETGRNLGEEAEARFLTQVRKSPEQVYALYEMLTVEPGAVLQQQAAELAGIVGGREDFQRALAYLLDPVLEGAAYEWLVGRDITTDQASRLGVGGPIREPQLCRYGIQLLVSITTRVGRPIIIVLDQCERLILDRDRTVYTSTVGLLHSLVETVPLANGMLVLVSNNEAWQALPRDFHQRIGHEVQVLSLSPDQAAGLLAEYAGAVTGTTIADDPYPFTPEAVRVLLELSGGNTRRLLQEAWEAFDQAPAGQPIGAAFVERTAGRGRGRITKADAMLGIEGVLFDAGLTFERDWQRNGMHADYAVPADSSPQVLIRISQAAFADDEAVHALSHANLMRQAQLAGLTARVVLVVLGYCSPDVLVELERAAHDVIVYNGPAAVDRLRAMLTELPVGDAAAAADSLEVTGAIDSLQQAVVARDQEVSQLRADIGQLLDRFTEAAEPSGRGAWKQRLQQLRDRIRDERKERRQREFADLEAEHARAERDRRIRYLISAAATGLPLVLLGAIMSRWTPTIGGWLSLVLIVAGLTAASLGYFRLMFRGLWSISYLIAVGAGICTAAIGVYVFSQAAFNFDDVSWYDVAVPVTQALLITLGLLIAGACTLVGFSVLGTQRDKQLARPAESIDRLNQAVRAYTASFRHPSRKARIGRLLKHPDPHVRYAAVTGIPADQIEYSWLAALFMEEPTAIIRRAAARAFGEAPPGLVKHTIHDGTDTGIPETVYLIEAAPEDLAHKLAEDLRPGTPPGLLARICDGHRDPVWLLTAVAEVAAPELDEEMLQMLRSWYRKGPGLTSRDVPERVLRRAADMLSPFERSGLGTFDELALIPDIDDVYLFFEQLIFSRNRDRDRDPQADGG